VAMMEARIASFMLFKVENRKTLRQGKKKKQKLDESNDSLSRIKHDRARN
jgi:hypothetical protein